MKKFLIIFIAGILFTTAACQGKDKQIEKENDTMTQEEKQIPSTTPTQVPDTVTEAAAPTKAPTKAPDNSNELKQVPAEYLFKNEQSGTIETIKYQTTYYRTNTPLEKTAYVYLPYGYDETRQYPIIYCLHGGEGNVRAYLGSKSSPGQIKYVLDNMIANGDIEPVIAVAPSYYKKAGDNKHSVDDIENFKTELLNDLIPAVEGTYSTYAETTDLEGIKASRDYRAYTGYSMGSLSTWVTFIQCNEYFHYYMPMSGDCWVNGVSNASKAAELLETTYMESGYTQDDIFIYAVTGDADIAYNSMKSQINSMKKKSPSFVFIEDGNENGNITFKVEPGATHDYKYLPLYFYNGLPMFFGK